MAIGRRPAATGLRFGGAFPECAEAALLTALAGIRRRYGYATDGRSLLLSEPVATHDRCTPIHQIEYYWDMLSPGLTGHPGQPECVVSPDEKGDGGTVESHRHHDIRCRDRYQSADSGGAKRWLPDCFADSTERLSRTLSDAGRRPAVAVIGARGGVVGTEIARV